MATFDAGNGQTPSPHSLEKLGFVPDEADGFFLAAAFDALPTRVVILDTNGLVVFANKVWCASFQDQHGPYSRGGFAYESLCSDCPTERDNIRRGIDAVRGGTSRSFRAVYRRFAGDETQWHCINVCRLTGAGHSYVVVTDEDLTETDIARETRSEVLRRFQAIQENERQRIAIGLHDSTAQHLTAIGLNLMALKERSRGRHNLSGIFQDMEMSLDHAQREVRVVSYLLHPPELENGGLKAALTRMVEGFAGRALLRAEAFFAPAVDAIPTEMQLAILRIVQEALSNVHRHAAATYVRVRVAQEENRIALSIADNGRGFAAAAQDRRPPALPGLGLAGMRSRVAEFGGKLDISTSGNGTTLTAGFPLTNLDQAAVFEPPLSEQTQSSVSCAPPKPLLAG